MKLSNFSYYILGAILMLACQTALAQGAETFAVGDLFKWATAGESPDIFSGAMYALLGLVGALITIFGLIGGAVPGTAGYSKIEAGLNRLEARASVLDKLILDADANPSTADASLIKAVQEANTSLRAYLRKERWSQFILATVLYAILGAFFAAMLAQNILQALVIGAGWTAYLGVLGLKKDFAERKAIKDRTTEKLEKAIRTVSSGNKKDINLTDLHEEAQVSKAL